MFAKSLAFSRVVMRWLVCIVVALALSGCAGSSMVSSTDVYKKTIVCSVAGGVTTIVIGVPVIGMAVKALCELWDRGEAVTYDVASKGISEIYEKAASGVVVVITDQDKFNIGAGAVISLDGHILISANVVADARNYLVLFLSDVRQQDKQKISYFAEKITVNQQNDLALLKLTQPPEKMTVLELASGSELQKGQTIYTIGHSDGSKESWSYSEGLVRDVVKDFKWTNPVSSVSYRADIAVQTQTPINPGTAGAFLFDDQGKLAGMFVSSDAKDDRVNYAISAKVFADFISQ